MLFLFSQALAQENFPVYRVADDSGRYLLLSGSLDYGTEEIEWEAEAILADVDLLAVETDEYSQVRNMSGQDLLDLMNAVSFEDDRLSVDFLSMEALDFASVYTGYTMEKLEPMRATTILSLCEKLLYQEAGMERRWGLKNCLLRIASRNEIPVCTVGLDMDGADIDDNDREMHSGEKLEAMCQDPGAWLYEKEQLLQAYRRNDEEQIRRLITEDSEDPWYLLNAVEDLITRDEKVWLVVDAEHFYTSPGLIEELTGMGYRVYPE